MKLRHALLADRVHPREDLLRRRYGLVGDVLNQFVGPLPGFRIGLANDYMQAYAERELASAPGGGGLYAGDLFGDLRPRLAPRQVFVDGIDGDIDAGVGRSAEIQRRGGGAHRAEKTAATPGA